MGTRRLFFALWLPEPVARALHGQARQLVGSGRGRLMRAETLHFTLAFLGEVDDARLPELMVIGARTVAARPAFALTIDRLERWSHNRIDWAGPGVVPPNLTALAADLRGALTIAGLACEPPVFVPHVTLVRQRSASTPPEAITPQHFEVDELRLVESAPNPQGADYLPLGRWPLKA